MAFKKLNFNAANYENTLKKKFTFEFFFKMYLKEFELR